ncbi:hypothetical protein BHE74_00023580, partial [Ensete ventricosum]
FTGKFIRSSSTSGRELAECSLEEYWEFVGSSPKEIRSSPEVHWKDARVHREFAERLIND